MYIIINRDNINKYISRKTKKNINLKIQNTTNLYKYHNIETIYKYNKNKKNAKSVYMIKFVSYNENISYLIINKNLLVIYNKIYNIKYLTVININNINDIYLYNTKFYEYYNIKNNIHYSKSYYGIISYNSSNKIKELKGVFKNKITKSLTKNIFYSYYLQRKTNKINKTNKTIFIYTTITIYNYKYYIFKNITYFYKYNIYNKIISNSFFNNKYLLYDYKYLGQIINTYIIFLNKILLILL